MAYRFSETCLHPSICALTSQKLAAVCWCPRLAVARRVAGLLRIHREKPHHVLILLQTSGPLFLWIVKAWKSLLFFTHSEIFTQMQNLKYGDYGLIGCNTVNGHVSHRAGERGELERPVLFLTHVQMRFSSPVCGAGRWLSVQWFIYFLKDMEIQPQPSGRWRMCVSHVYVSVCLCTNVYFYGAARSPPSGTGCQYPLTSNKISKWLLRRDINRPEWQRPRQVFLPGIEDALTLTLD